MHKAPELAGLKRPALLYDTVRLAPDALEHWDVHAPQVAEAAHAVSKRERDEVERGDGREVPFHVWEDEEPVRVCRRRAKKHLFSFGGARQDVLYPVHIF